MEEDIHNTHIQQKTFITNTEFLHSVKIITQLKNKQKTWTAVSQKRLAKGLIYIWTGVQCYDSSQKCKLKP